ncbi:MAG: bifunctional MFS transporter/dTMP kinase [Pseudonocardia sp.]
MGAIVSGPQPSGSPAGLPHSAAPTAHRVRSVLAIPAFRRLWLVTAVSATGDWLSLLALSALATQLATGYQAQSFALGGVVATKLLPALVLGPLAGALADKFDRRRVMVVCDLLRFGLFLSIPLVGSLWWLLVATLLIEICALFWIPAKDASVPNLLRRPDQIETANQLALVMTYGVAVITASGLFTVISSLGGFLPGSTPEISTAYVALVLNGLAYLLTATTVWFGIREISGRAAQRREAAPGLVALLRDGLQFVASTPLVRGLVIGIIGAFTAGGVVIGSATLYAASLGGGNAAYGMLFIAVFVGLAIGMGAAPRLSRRLPHNRLFGTAIVAAGCALVLVALAPHLTVAIGAVGLVGGFAGIAFLTGLTIIGAQVADEVRGRIVAFVQSIVRLTLLGSMALVPLLVGLVSARTVELFGYPYRIDGTRVVMLVGGVIAAIVGMFAYRQMDDRRTEPLLPDLLAALRRGVRRGGSGVLIAIEGATEAETAEQTQRLVSALSERGHRVVVAGPGQLRAEPVAASSSLAGPRAGALAEAAARADLVERVVRPALADGAVVVADRFLASPLVQLGVTADRMQAELDAAELESLAAFATGRLRPDVSVLLDRAPATEAAAADLPAGDDTIPIPLPGEEHLRVRRLLTRMAAAEPHRYVVVEAEGTPDEVARKVLAALTPVLPKPPVSKNGPEGTTGSSTPPPGTTTPSTSHGPAPATAAAPGAVTPLVGRASTDPGRPTPAGPAPAGPAPAGPTPGGAAPDGAAAGSGAVTTVVDDGKIAVSGAKPAPVRFWHRWRRS